MDSIIHPLYVNLIFIPVDGCNINQTCFIEKLHFILLHIVKKALTCMYCGDSLTIGAGVGILTTISVGCLTTCLTNKLFNFNLIN